MKYPTIQVMSNYYMNRNIIVIDKINKVFPVDNLLVSFYCKGYGAIYNTHFNIEIACK